MEFLVSLIEKYGLLAVFLNMFVEGLGLHIPSYLILMIAAALAPQLHYSLLSVIAIGMSTALLAKAGHQIEPPNSSTSPVSIAA